MITDIPHPINEHKHIPNVHGFKILYVMQYESFNVNNYSNCAKYKNFQTPYQKLKKIHFNFPYGETSTARDKCRNIVANSLLE